MPASALGCQTTNVSALSRPAAAKNAFQSRPAARLANSERFQWLLPFCTSSVSTRVAWASAMRFSSSKMRGALAAASATPASPSTVAMCA